MAKKLVTIPIIPGWLAEQIEAAKNIKAIFEEVSEVRDDTVLVFLLNSSNSLSEDRTFAGKYIAEHMIDVAIAIKYGYEVEDD